VIADDLAISPRSTRLLLTRKPYGRTRPPTRKPTFAKVPQLTQRPTPNSTSESLCRKAFPKDIEIACSVFGGISVEDCQAALSLESNRAQLTIPNEIGHLVQLTSLYFILGKGSIPSSISCLTSLEYLYIYGSEYTGTLPDSLSSLTKLTSLHIGRTRIQGELPEIFSTLGNIHSLQIYSNRFYGRFPSSISSLTKLTNFQFYDNFFSGVLPSLPTSLQKLEITGNSFTGILVLPTSLNSLVINEPSLQRLPTSLSDMSKLTSMIIRSTKLGTIPTVLVSLPNLYSLQIGANDFTGTIPTLPTSLVDLVINNNKLTNIPSSLSSLKRLRSLNLNSNKLLGTIPSLLAGLTNLEKLSLVDNQLTGNIPQAILSMRFLGVIDIRDNGLVGSISTCGSKSISVDCGEISCTCCNDLYGYLCP
jgi:Leucine-rich repeat (LRR) protein